MTTPAVPLRFAVAGLGYIGRRHCHTIQHTPGAVLAAAAEPDPARQHPAELPAETPVYPDLTSLLAARATHQAQVACLCTPNWLHAPQAMAALDAGMHVLIEKPMAIRLADCEAVLHRALQAGHQVFIVMQNRYSPTAKWLKEVVDQGLLGRILMVQVNCYWNRDQRYYAGNPWKGRKQLDGGALFTQFSHFVDILYWVFGDVQDIQARMDNLTHRQLTDIDDTGTVHFRLANGQGMGVLNYSTSVWDCNLESSITVVGEYGSLKIGGQYMNHVDYCHIRDYTMPQLPPANPPNNYGAYQGSAANHSFVFQNVMDTLTGAAAPATNALEGLKVVGMIERMYAAAGIAPPAQATDIAVL